MPRRTTDERWMLALGIIGILLSLYALSLHFADSGSRICNLSANFNCDKVNKSPWSAIAGIPVAFLGLLAYAALTLIILKRHAIARATGLTERDVWQYLAMLVTVMFLFQAYLTLAEVLWIHAYCLVCLLSQAAVIVLLFLAWRRFLRTP